jgi:hypothetical protein
VGILTYNSTRTLELEDRLLAHLRAVMFAKLRRGESFSFSWEQTPQQGSGRSSAWIGPDTALTFQFFDHRDIPLNADWLRRLTKAANSPAGLVPVPEVESEPARQE